MAVCLIVDDSRVIRKVARRIIEAMGFACDEAEDGQKALDFCLAKLPQVIMLDWNMPVMDGLEFLTALRAMPRGGEPVVIFCTTENNIDKIKQVMHAGANEYIMKPFDAEIIAGKFFQTGLVAEAAPQLLHWAAQ